MKHPANSVDFSQLDNVLIVLVGTTHPGNIGAVARAMKTMGLGRLALVNPKRFPCAEASARAAGADDVLYEAGVFDSPDAALADCRWVVGTTARTRSLPCPEFSPRECAKRLIATAQTGQVALVFGREHSGLTNEELDRCHAVVRIPANPAYQSLNLASAVQVLSYELRMACLDTALSGGEEGPNARRNTVVAMPGGINASEWEGLFRHLEVALQDVGYYDPAKPKKLMRRLRRFFQRAGLDHSELNILRGILSAAQQAAKRDSDR
uniref:tRNA (cytidine/uridine-2'-O-)-methyltransferase TrmJ n=1 Tax=Candidatus Kentrum sp. DK TaxID=2126562 RepID=A0A450SBZ4_9GAMM|nr:MAG: tRNA (cytidine32/uridine32-2'-O)-methyltransferase [Candidatus Kentron sp. DK]